MIEVLKRDKKTKECFQEHKIHHAIESAYLSVGKNIDEDVFCCVIERLGVKCMSEDAVLNVEDIQDSIEKCLFDYDIDVAISFHDYRLTHKLIRNEKKGLAREFAKKLMCENIENQNANVDEYSFGGRMAEAGNVYKKDFALNNCVSKQTKRNHLNNESYVHDLDNYASGEHNCQTCPLDDLLANGAKVGQTNIRPAGSVNSAMQLTAVYFQIQSQEQFGGVSASHYDWTMVPYVRKSFFKHYLLNYLKDQEDFDGLTVLNMTNDELDEWVDKHKDEFLAKFNLKKEDFRLDNLKKLDKHYANSALFDTKIELMQATEALYHNLNTLQSRPGSQLPFSSMNYGSCTLPEGQMVIEALLDGSLRGTGKHHLTPIFPCGIFQLGKGINRKPGDPNYYLFQKALKSTAKRIYPNYANLDWSGNKGYDKNDPKTYFSTMGCHAIGTKIVMADGTRKNVEDIVVGDKLAGVNNGVRTVEKLIQGVGKMYKVEQSMGETYVVNDGHILSLKNELTNEVINITINDYLDLLPENYKGYNNFNSNLSDLIITPLDEDNFYGFELDGDRLYLLDDGTVTHNCRTANGWDINGFGQLKDGRGNICPQTIIMPTLAMQVLDENEVEDLRNGIISGDQEKKLDKFMRLLSRKIDQTKDSLIERFDWIASQNPKSAPFMWTNGTMAGYIPEEGIRSALKHGTLAIGQLGLAETLQILIGKNHTTEEGMELAKRIERLFRKKCADFKEEYKLNFGVYFTPAENLCYTAMKKFKDKYGIIPNVSDRPYFTNSIHVPVWESMTPFQKIDIESQLTGYSSAGCITYVEVDSKVRDNIEALEEMVNYAMDSDIPYFAINFPIDNCKDCGYSGEMDGDTCPICCTKNIEHLGRVTGYLSSDIRRFNYGKQAEFGDRVDHEEHILV